MSVLPVGIGPVTGYNIQRSLRFRSSASAYLSRTPAGAGSQTTFTISMWVKRGILGAWSDFFEGYASALSYADLQFTNTDNIVWYNQTGGSITLNLITSAVYRDPSAWYHIVATYDSTQATSSNRAKLYVNGVQVTAFSTATYPSQNTTSTINGAVSHTIGRFGGASNYFDGYLTEINFIDGQALDPSSFGSTNATTGVWQPIQYTGSYGTNGFYLPFTDNSALTSGSNVGLGKDFSGNGNYWNTNNISITSGSTYDSMTDVPTLTSATQANYPVANPLFLYGSGTGNTWTNGNLYVTAGATGTQHFRGTFGSTTGKWYFETTILAAGTGGAQTHYITITTPDSGPAIYAAYDKSGQKYTPSAGWTSGWASFTTGDVIGIALDCGAGTAQYFKNNTSQGTLSFSPGGAILTFGSYLYNGASNAFNFGQQPFTYTPPSGFVALNTFNLPTPTIQNGAAYMAATLWTGDGTNPRTITNTVNGVSFQPDLVWTKARNQAYDNSLYDSVRGATNYLISNSTAAQASAANSLQAFNSDGFQVGGNNYTNSGSVTYVGWQWKGGGSGVTNTNGSITSTVSANTTAGFSIVTYTGNGTAGATVGHGLGIAPSMIICKNRSASADWTVYHSSLGNTQYLYLSTTGAAATSINAWQNTSPTSSVFSLGISANLNGSGNGIVAYCFSAVSGYSAFGSYTGNGSTDGTFVYTGFRPRWVLIKSTGVEDWILHDTARNPYNACNLVLYPNSSQAEDNNPTYRLIDILSNGFKMRSNQGQENGNGTTYIYAAFAENPFKVALAR